MKLCGAWVQQLTLILTYAKKENAIAQRSVTDDKVQKERRDEVQVLSPRPNLDMDIGGAKCDGVKVREDKSGETILGLDPDTSVIEFSVFRFPFVLSSGRLSNEQSLFSS